MNTITISYDVTIHRIVIKAEKELSNYKKITTSRIKALCDIFGIEGYGKDLWKYIVWDHWELGYKNRN